ncbi:MAG: dihydroorotase [Gemmatimonadetes bacterium]|nr:dihydroorotase [Gemmatimonadota bacterium]
MKILIKGGRVIDPATGTDDVRDVLVEDGVIVAVDRNIEADDARTVDASGLAVAPGLVDMHVHFREPGYEYKEDIASGSRSAASGGFTTVACMPNTNPSLDNEALVSRVIRRGEEAGLCRVHPIAAITKGQAGRELTEMMLLRDAGAVGFSDDGVPVEDSRVMRRALEYSQLTGAPIISHSEDTALSRGGHMHEGAVSTRLGIEGIPSASEDAAVARDTRIAEITGGRLHICHVSSARSVEVIRDAKARGVRVTAEATPHHFTLTDQEVVGFDTRTKMNPPLREETDRQALIAGLKDGTLEVIATDHAPHAELEKLVEYDRAPFGIIGLETSLALGISTLVGGGHLTLTELVDRMALAPARILGLDAGTLRPGVAADICVFNPDEEWTFTKQDVFSKSKNSPFFGTRMTGRVLLTLLAGRAVHERPEIRERLAPGRTSDRTLETA